MDVLSVVAAVLVILVTTVVIYAVYMSRNFRVFNKMGIPYRRPWPALGNFGDISKMGLFEYHKEGYNTFAPAKAYGTFEPGQPVLIIRDLDMIRDIMVKHFNNFVNRRVLLTEKPLSNSVSFLKGDHWRHVRKTISPAFSSGKLKRMYPHVEEHSKALTSYFDEARQSGDDVDLKHVMGCYTMDVIASTGFGVKSDSIKNKSSRFEQEAYNLMNLSNAKLTLVLMFPFLLKFLNQFGYTLFPKSTMDFFCSFVDSAIEERKKTDITAQKRSDFIQLVVEESKKQEVSRTEGAKVDDDGLSRWKGLSLLDIQGQSIIFIIAGYDTTSTTMSFMMHELAHHPDVCARLQEEIDSVLEGEFPSYDTAQKLTYMDMCINETIRMYPAGFVLDRVCTEECVVGDITIPVGLPVLIPAFAIHRDPKHFPNPDKFDPERFSPENKEKLHPFAHLPFGQGPRMCIGTRLALMEMKVALAAILQEMTPVPSPKSVYPPKLKKFQLAAEDGLLVKMVSRKQL